MKKKRYSEEKIIQILHEAERGEQPISEICRKHGISEQSFYRWRKKYGGMQVDEVRHLRELTKENARLKKLLAERDIEIDAMKELLEKNGDAFSKTRGSTFAQSAWRFGTTRLLAVRDRAVKFSLPGG